MRDSTAAAGKAPKPERHVEVAVVGAGPAGLAAALAAAEAGASVLLVDENPVAAGLMALDVPLHFGQRMNAAVQNQARMVERLVETNPGLAEAFERGIEVALGTYAWGAWMNGPSVGSLERPLLALADETRSWAVAFDRLIVAAGARDLGLGFPGWEKPGVMGGQAASLLLTRYQAFDGRRLVVLGSGPTGLAFALDAKAAGLEVAAVVEVAATAQRPAELVHRLAVAGIPLLTRHMPREALGRAEVEALRLAALDGGADSEIACDTVVLAAGPVPVVELLDVLNCRLAYDAGRGGYVPLTDGDGRTSVPGIYAAGDCAGFDAEALLDPTLAALAGRRCGKAVAADLRAGRSSALGEPVPAPAGPPIGVAAAQPWLAALRATAGGTQVCLCEEVTRRELLDLRPPRYLGCAADARHALDGLAGDGPLNADQVKRLTRAGMGPCQGRRCREQVQHLLGGPERVALASHRMPVRPLPLAALADRDELAAVGESWTAWFNIATQWTPHWEQQPVPFPRPAIASDQGGK